MHNEKENEKECFDDDAFFIVFVLVGNLTRRRYKRLRTCRAEASVVSEVALVVLGVASTTTVLGTFHVYFAVCTFW
jgi:hypothetical protein